MGMTALPVVKRLDGFKNSRSGFLAGIVKFSVKQLHLQGVKDQGILPDPAEGKPYPIQASSSLALGTTPKRHAVS